MRDSFEVFFSYHTVDHAIVTQVARRLHERGVRVFLDRWYLAAGQPWPQALEQTLASCGTVAVFLGAEGLGPWQQRERDLALDRQGREPGFAVIPVLLSRADPALGFLKLNTWVDLSAGVTDEGALETLAAAIRGQPPGPVALQQIEAVRAEICPYRGLRPFREEDEPFFFGRAAFTEMLAATLARQPFVAVVGASGSGKSSVVRAGLIPRLRRGEGGLVWDIIPLVPTERPLASLAAALLLSLEPDLTEVDRLAEVNKLATHLADGSVSVRDVIARILQKQRGTDRLLLFVDQWEEFYTLCPDEQMRRALTAQFLEACAAGHVCIVLTMRGDFYGRALADRALSDQLQDAVVNIGPMTRAELAETIVKPAESVGLALEAGLAETILDDVGDEPGRLPLLEFLLEALWKERRGALLHYDAYQRLGRVSGAIAHRAEKVFERGLSEAERQAAQRLLIRMVRPGEGVEDTRQRAAMPETDPVAEATIRKLADARLVVTERDAASGRETVEVAHEALIRGWQRLRDWVDQDREFLRTRERISDQARVWEREGRPPSRLLPPGRPLAEGEDLLATRRADLEPSLVSFIDTSAAAARANERRQQQQRRYRWYAMVFACMALLMLATSVGSVWLYREAIMQKAAIQARQASHIIAASPDDRRLAIAYDGTVRICGLDTDERPHNPSQELHIREQVMSVAFGRSALAIATSHYAQIWTIPEHSTSKPELAMLLQGHRSLVLSVAFNSIGDHIVTASQDGTARIWNVSTGKTEHVLMGHEQAVFSAAFSHDGSQVVTASFDGSVRIWNVSTGKQMRSLPAATGGERSISAQRMLRD